MRTLTVLMCFVLVNCKTGETGECEDDLRVTGSFEMSDSRFTIDEGEGEGLTFSTVHKIDVDLYEAGCFGQVNMQIKTGGQGCTIGLEFEPNDDGQQRLASIAFSADSYCPNFSDRMEGEYVSTGAISVRQIGLPSGADMEIGTEEEVCIEDMSLKIDASGTLDLVNGTTQRDFDLSLRLTGDYISTGSTSTACY